MKAAVSIMAVLACVLAASVESRSEPASLLVSSPGPRRLHYVAPVMPQVAIDQKLKGFVEVTFTIATDGTTQNVEVSRAQPEGIFEEAALTAVRQWIFEPVTKDGQPVAQRAMMRVNFELPEA